MRQHGRKAKRRRRTGGQLRIRPVWAMIAWPSEVGKALSGPRETGKKKVVAVAVVLAVAGLLGWQIYARVQEQAAAAAGGARAGGAPVAVEVTPVRRETIREVAEFTGTLLPRAQFVVAPKVGGRLEKLLVNIGDRSTTATWWPCWTARSTPSRSPRRAPNWRSARPTWPRPAARWRWPSASTTAPELREQKVASESELDEAQAHYRAAEAKYEVAEAQIKQKRGGPEGRGGPAVLHAHPRHVGGRRRPRA